MPHLRQIVFAQVRALAVSSSSEGAALCLGSNGNASDQLTTDRRSGIWGGSAKLLRLSRDAKVGPLPNQLGPLGCLASRVGPALTDGVGVYLGDR